ncbi:hypothetical protein AYR72_gp103 [Cnaphalocrocis medinalis granulovirus]|nr:hypothetical protein AYR72_gp103 [Cnaphalocrocis medinalis granulovirus]AMF83854.1 hypothetical protein [Cnaphalocrocis medinalis granulovirus]WPN08736.1 hypothetical protein [Cnaphalocrocis medinalis granulovirus]
MDKILLQTKKRLALVNVLNTMVQANTLINNSYRVKQKFLSKLSSSDIKRLVCDAFDVLKDDECAKEFVKNSFYKNSQCVNIVLLSILQHDQCEVMCNNQERVKLEMYVTMLGDYKLCKMCYEHINKYEEIIFEYVYDENVVVLKSEAYKFACSFVCDYCFTNKLYSAM